MNKRALISSVSFVLIFVMSLYFLYLHNKISMASIVCLLFGGAIFVLLTKVFYKNFWGKDE
jgi:hypothetical protein